jgi:hypothetical protein
MPNHTCLRRNLSSCSKCIYVPIFMYYIFSISCTENLFLWYVTLVHLWKSCWCSIDSLAAYELLVLSFMVYGGSDLLSTCLLQFNEEARSPFVKKYKTIVHPGEVRTVWLCFCLLYVVWHLIIFGLLNACCLCFFLMNLIFISFSWIGSVVLLLLFFSSLRSSFMILWFILELVGWFIFVL